MPLDRAYAVENGSRDFDPLAPRHFPKVKFLQLMSNERLASLTTDFETNNHLFSISKSGKRLAAASLLSPVGRTIIEQFLSAYLGEDLRGAPTIVDATDWSFSDIHQNVVSLINLATVRDLELRSGKRIDPLRFRANLYIDGIPPWSEYDWVHRPVAVNRQKAFEALDPIERCAATHVDPTTGARDLHLTRLIEGLTGHRTCGIYLRVTAPVTLSETGCVLNVS